MTMRGALAVALLVAASSAGCARLVKSYDLAPSGLTRSEDRWRTMLSAGHVDTAAVDEPGDELLRMLYLGTAAHYNAEYDKSNQYLEAAAALSDDRITKSISRSVLSLISNDGVLPYTPARSERLLIPYYTALNYIALGRMQDAAVEARRLSALLETEAADGGTTDLSDDVRQLRATMRSLAGAIFEATGNRNDALVAYRNAAALGAVVDTSALVGGAGTALGVSADSGTVVVLLENGFVAHRVEQNLFVWLGPDEMTAFSTGGPSDDRAHTASSVASRVVSQAFPRDRRDWGRRRGDVYVNLPPDLQHSRRHVQCVTDNNDVPAITQNKPASDSASIGNVAANAPPPRRAPSRVTPPRSTSAATRNSRDCREDEDVPYLLKVAWPVYTGAASPSNGRMIVGADTLSVKFADLSGAVVNDYSSQVPLVVARTVARGAAKAALTRSAKRKASEKSEGLGKLIGLLGNVGNVMLEHADTRSWHLLPAGVAVVRVRAPVGQTDIRASVNGRTVDLGTITIEPGTAHFVAKRVF
jgi:hypothetical protein